MVVCMVFSPPPDVFTKQTYDKVLELLGDGFPPPAMRLHVMGHTDRGEVRIVDIFESAEAFAEFAKSHAPAYEEMGISLETVLEHVTLFNIEKMLAK